MIKNENSNYKIKRKLKIFVIFLQIGYLFNNIKMKLHNVMIIKLNIINKYF